jgi:hypothetical protein
MKEDLFKTCKVRNNSTIIPQHRGEFASILNRVNDCFSIQFASGEIECLVHKDELERFCL